MGVTWCSIVLKWISVYWFSRPGPAASLRIYYEMSKGGTASGVLEGAKWTNVPVGVSYFPGELARQPKSCVNSTDHCSRHTETFFFAARDFFL